MVARAVFSVGLNPSPRASSKKSSRNTSETVVNSHWPAAEAYPSVSISPWSRANRWPELARW
jgi:hypothetical protein